MAGPGSCSAKAAEAGGRGPDPGEASKAALLSDVGQEVPLVAFLETGGLQSLGPL